MTTRTVSPLVAALAAVCLLAPAAWAEMPTLSLAMPELAPATDAHLTATEVVPVAGLSRQGELDLDRLAPPAAAWIVEPDDDNAPGRLEVTVAARQPAAAQPGAGGGAERSSAL